VGEQVWKRFVGAKDGTLWYYRALAHTFKTVQPGFLADELDRTVAVLEQISRV
jgi:hypothetical protein